MRVVVPSRYDDLCHDFLWSLAESQPGTTSSVIVLDNGLSPDMHRRWPFVTFVDVDREPFRYASAVNIGVAVAYPEDVLILGDDMQMITPNWLSVAQDVFERWPAKFGSLNLLQNDQRQDDKETVASPVSLGLGVTLIPRHVWDWVGQWDERYDGGYGYEDWDYNVQLWHRGLLVGTTSVLRVKHPGTETWKRKLGGYDAVVEACRRSHRLFYDKWGMPFTEEIKPIAAAPHLGRLECGCKP